MREELRNNEEGHRCRRCEDQGDPTGRRMRMVIDRMRRKGEVPMTESDLEQWLKDGKEEMGQWLKDRPSAIDGKKWFSPPTPMTQSELDEWMKECSCK